VSQPKTLKAFEIKEFAGRVERVCDFLMDRHIRAHGRDGSKDQKIIEDLKEDAADIQYDRVDLGLTSVDGLHDYVNGVTENS
jgi:hypothetical protein